MMSDFTDMVRDELMQAVDCSSCGSPPEANAQFAQSNGGWLWWRVSCVCGSSGPQRSYLSRAVRDWNLLHNVSFVCPRCDQNVLYDDLSSQFPDSTTGGS